ncbi:MAG TPA: hypothetical protein DCE78_10340 [Bacteroidetes bacterium]|nr:hypothetical protein [Bacteroidota bacterium]
MPKKHHVTIIGLGPRGVNLVDRLLANITVINDTGRLHLHIIEPGYLGCGVHTIDQPSSLLVNTVASQITMYTDESVVGAGPALPGPCLYSWVQAEGYKYDEASRQYKKFTGRDIHENDYLPRAIFGQYLNATAHTILDQLQQYCEITVYSQKAVSIEKLGKHQFNIQLEDQTIIPSNYVFLTTGHATNNLTTTEQSILKRVSELTSINPNLSFVANPYPVIKVTQPIHNNMSIAIEGFGLTATDIISELTIGKGGRFEVAGNIKHYRYIPSGKEPKKIIIYSNTGLPFAGRAMNQKGVSGQYKPIFFTLDAIQTLRNERGIGLQKQLDFEAHVLPLLLAEMRYCYVITFLKREIKDEHAIQTFSNQWIENKDQPDHLDRIEHDAIGYENRFNWQVIMNPMSDQIFPSEDAYRAWLLNYLRQDIEASFEGNVVHPFKAACDVLRDVRDTIRSVIDFSGLTPESHRVFMTKYMPVMNRISVGPPKERIVELLALIEADLVDIFVGSSPNIRLNETTGTFFIQGKNITGVTPREVDQIIKARISSTNPTQDQSQLMQGALKNGLFCPFQNGDYTAGGIRIDREFHPINAQGESEKGLYALGTVVEGAKFYTYIVPRRGVNSTALVDAGKLILNLLTSIKAEEKQLNRFSMFHPRSATTSLTPTSNGAPLEISLDKQTIASEITSGLML